MVESQFLQAAERALSSGKKKPVKPAVDHSGISGAVPASAAVVVSDAAAGSPLALVERGRRCDPPRVLIYGIDGVGKSTWAASAPRPIFIQTEDGLGQIDCERFPLAREYRDVAGQLSALATGKHEYQSVVVDSLDWLERLIWQEVCRRTNASNIEKAGGGFAKGYVFSLDEWRDVLSMLDACRARGMAIILVAHAKIERFEDPENPAYDRYSPRLNKHAEALVREWVDATLFATRRLVVRKEGEGFNERSIAAPMGADGGERIIRTVGGPACVAKNRYALPPEMPLSWAAFAEKLEGFYGNGNKKEA